MHLPRSLAVATLIALALSSCTGLRKKDRPLDINKNLPDVDEVISAVQGAIDRTASNTNWKPSAAFDAAKKQCKTEEDKADLDCESAYTVAHAACKHESGATASALCGDHLRAAAAKCDPGPYPACESKAMLKAPRIKSATLLFTAAVYSEVGVGASLKLISAEMARKGGRASSFSVELVPMPKEGRERKDEPAAALYQDLEAALTVALNAAYPEKCDARVRAAISKGCPDANTPQLILKKASYSVELSYVTTKGGGFKWSASPVKITEGTFNLGTSNTLGNVLTVEIER